MDPQGFFDTTALLHRAIDGDRVAESQFWSRFLPRLRRIAKARGLPAHVRRVTGTDDLVQDAVVRTHRKLKRFRSQRATDYLKYLTTVIRHLAMDRLRKHWNARGVSLENDEVESRQPSPLEKAIGAEQLRRYDAALDELSKEHPESYTAYMLRFEMGMSWAEVGREMGLTPDAARMKVRRIIEELVKRFAQ